MSIIKLIEFYSYDINTLNMIEVAETVVEIENDVIISSNLRRHVLAPIDDYSNETNEIQAICEELFTQDVKDAYIAHLESLKPIYTIEELRKMVFCMIDKATFIALQQPFSYDNNIYSGDDCSVDLLHKSIAGYDIIGEVPEGFTWWDVNNVRHSLLLADLKAMAVIIVNTREVLYQQNRTDKDALVNKTEAELKAMLGI